VGVFVALVEDLLLGGRVSVVLHAQGVDLVADAPFDARLRFAQRLLRAGSVRRAPPLRSALAQGGLEGGHVLCSGGLFPRPKGRGFLPIRLVRLSELAQGGLCAASRHLCTAVSGGEKRTSC
jgi:hypothetical protein